MAIAQSTDTAAAEPNLESKLAGTAVDVESSVSEPSPGSVAKRFGVNLRRTDVERLHKIARAMDVTPTDAIRRAIATEFKLLEIIRDGGHVLVERSDGRLLELDLNY